MADLASGLKALAAQVLDHSYSYESFGSWWVILRYRGIPFRIVFDGRDGRVVIQRSDSRKPPYDWEVAVWERAVGRETEWNLHDLVEAMRAQAAAS
jgi:hypothetical protein